MRTTIIPAQITTVEDKIAGSLNLNQILILMIPVFWAAIVYAFLVPIMKLSTFKLGLILIVAFICLILAFRIKEKIIAEWLSTLAKNKTWCARVYQTLALNHSRDIYRKDVSRSPQSQKWKDHHHA